MYSYYLVTNIWPEYKQNLWWKKYITQMQMVSFTNTVNITSLGILDTHLQGHQSNFHGHDDERVTKDSLLSIRQIVVLQ